MSFYCRAWSGAGSRETWRELSKGELYLRGFGFFFFLFSATSFRKVKACLIQWYVLITNWWCKVARWHTGDFVLLFWIFLEPFQKQLWRHGIKSLHRELTPWPVTHIHCWFSESLVNTFLGSCCHYFLYRKTTVVHYTVSAAILHHVKVLCIMIYCQHIWNVF